MIDKISGVGSPAALYATEATRMRGTVGIKPGAGGEVAIAASGTGASASVSFAQSLKGALDQVNQAQTQSEEVARQFQMGNPKVSLEEMMISAQTASIGFQTLVQTRNRLVNAYNEIMNMPV